MSSALLLCDHAIWIMGAALGGAGIAELGGRVNPQVGAAYGACFYVAEQVGQSLLNRLFIINEENAPVLTQRVKLCFGFIGGGAVTAVTGHSWKLGVALGLGVLGVKSLLESCLKPKRSFT